MYKKISKIALKGIALAMGVAVIVMSALKTLDVNTGFDTWSWVGRVGGCQLSRIERTA